MNKSKSKIYFVVGELSGEKHAADLIVELKKQYKNIDIRGRGGPLMKDAGCDIAFDYREMAIMGFTKVLLNLGKIMKHLRQVEQDIRQYNPDKIVMVDYPGFNLKLAGRIFEDYPLYYYIAPKVWAWNTGRVHKIQKFFKGVYSILPFEVDFFKKNNVPIKYVGNPSVFQVKSYQESHPISEKKYLALLPGSRYQEIEKMLPNMIHAANQLQIPFKISKAPNIEQSFYESFNLGGAELVEDMYQLLNCAKLALVTSGTATLETALFDVPQVVVYKSDPISYQIGKRVIKVPYISLVNLIVGKEVVTELIQNDCQPETIIKQLEDILKNPSAIAQGYKQMSSELGQEKPHEQVAKELMSDLIF